MKKLIAILLAAVLLLACPAAALAAAPGAAPNTFVSAVNTALHADRGNAVTRASANLLRRLTGDLKSVTLNADDLRANTADITGVLADVLGADAADLLKRPAAATGALLPQTGTLRTLANTDGSVSFAALADILKRYVFIKVDNADEVAALIAESSDFTYAVVEDGKGTVYICVDVEQNPQVFNYGVFRKLVEDLYARQGEEMIKNGDGSTDYVMSYERIAGELAMHALLYAATSELLRITGGKGDRLLSLYRSAAQADLNYNESRVPTGLITLFGSVLMNSVTYSMLQVFNMA